MKVEIWSDVMCPFCYIGKRKFEHALAQFEHKENVEIEWKSFQLNPSLKTDPNKNINQYLAEIKGWSVTYAQQLNNRVTEMAKDVGLVYDFDKAVVANSFNAHRLTHLAKKNEKGDAMEERLFRAYFTEGKNIDDHETLRTLAADIGLDSTEVNHLLESHLYADAVQNDAYEAQQVGAQGVPFYVFDNRFAVSGAQPTEIFLNVLNQAMKETNRLAG